MKIEGSIPSFYSATSRISSEQASKTIAADEIAKQNSADASESSLNSGLDYGRSNTGVKQTVVSPENSYQKTMMNDPSFAMDRLAGKLMDKLPQIMEDMRKLPSQEEKPKEMDYGFAKVTVGKVVISENSRVDYQADKKQELQDISLV